MDSAHSIELSSSTAVFACTSVEETLTYYKEVIGFTSSWSVGDPPFFGAVNWGDVRIMFNQQEELAARVRGHEHSIYLEEIDRLYAIHMRGGANIVEPIENKPWDIREYVVEDINGYRLHFTGPTSDHSKLSSPLPHGVTIERKKPSADDYAEIESAAFGKPMNGTEWIDKSWGGVIARSAESEPIGALRIMMDSTGWFSIWDVVVKPNWQGRHVGLEMMMAALETIRTDSPGATVNLFAAKYGFYEKLGFHKGTTCIRRV